MIMNAFKVLFNKVSSRWCVGWKFITQIKQDAVIKYRRNTGNGPSGICLSYMLAGNWPYYTGEPHPGDEMLTARLHFSTCPGNEECNDETEQQTKNASINQWQQQNRSERDAKSQGGRGLARSTRCKLECLSSGLEGRVGGRPLALLIDQLQHPCVDVGLDVPSLLTWKSVKQHTEHKVIDHVVLGKGEPGGSWQTMDPNVLTISLNRWMSLPDLDIRHWEMLIECDELRRTKSMDGKSCAYAFQETLNTCKPTSRISVGTVAAYYKDYVRRKEIQQYFRCGTIVTSVRPACVLHDKENNGYGWIVEGFEMQTKKQFRYRCKSAVLATGTTDLSNRLGIPGEISNSNWVTHDLNDLETKLDRLVDQQQLGKEQMNPVLVIGAGLSAADAIMAARFRGIPVLHVFRDSSVEWTKSNAEKIYTKYDKLQGLPSSMYPEYHKVYEMMADGGTNYPLYRALPGYTLVKFGVRENDSIDASTSDHRAVTLAAPNGQIHTFHVSIAAILIGYKPDLSYLENSGIGLGKFPDRPIDSKLNPVEVDDFTYEVTKAQKNGLYALGPLAGDNFVRYILGGAFGILVHILSSSTV